VRANILDTHVAPVFLGILGLLICSTVLVWALGRVKPSLDLANIKLRIRSWWIMAVVFCIALVLRRTVSLIFFGLISFLALKEYLSLIPTRRADRIVLLWAYASIPIQYFWVGIGAYGMFIVFIPVYMFLFLPVHMLIIGETTGFLRAAGTLHWGMMTAVFSLSHAAYLLMLRAHGAAYGGGAGLLLYLVVLTQANDVAQFIWGKLFGHAKIVPRVSPNKTWEGLVGGVLTTTTLAVLLAPLLTPMGWRGALIAGVMIGVAGFFGDLTISALKRDLGIKDTGSVIPGHGGILDRVDSLTYTAPLFLHFVRYFYF
jgi:phosphatidate cytidylyltransferase